jgi:hypothetical protein
MTPEQKTIYTDPSKAYEWSCLNGRFPEAEPYISRKPSVAYAYARTHKVRLPEAEPHFTKDAFLAYKYAKFVVKARWPEAERTIMESVHCRSYLDLFPEAKDDWILKGWLDWLDA